MNQREPSYRTLERQAAAGAAIGGVFFGLLTAGISAFLYWGYFPARAVYLETPAAWLIPIADMGSILMVGAFSLPTVALLICAVMWGLGGL